jgi:hypothetical protein
MNMLKQTRFNFWTLIFVFLILLYILPIWIFRYFPSQDGPCHIYNSFILKNYDNPEYVFNKYYEIRKSPIPNWVSHAVMMFLMYLVPPLIAEKLLLTGYVALMAFSMFYFVNNVEGGRLPLVFVGLPFIYNYLFLMGFYNFCLGVGMLILIMGYWWRHFDNFRIRNALYLSLMMVITYFCHLVPLVLSMFSVVVISVLSLPPGFKKWKQALLSILSTLPAIGLTLFYTETRGTAKVIGSWTLSRLWEYFIRSESLAYHSESQIIFGRFVAGAFIALFFYTLIRDHFFAEEWRFGFRIEKKDFLLILCIAFFIIYLRAPDAMSGGGFIKTRMAFMPFLIIIPWFSWDMPKLAKIIIGGALAALSAAYIIHASYYHRILNNEVKMYTSGYHVIEKNKVILPLSFNHRGKGWRIGSFLHAVGHYGYTTGCIDLDNYEATTKYFPTYFKSDFHRPELPIIEAKPQEMNFTEYKDDVDYVITWTLADDSDVEKGILEHYSLIMHNENLKIFKRKPPG